MQDERFALKLSAIAYLAMAALGIGFAFLTGSDAIMLSGFFSLIAFVMGLLSLKVSQLLEIRDDVRFNFGYAYFEPLLNALKGIIIIAVCALSLAGAIQSMLSGGSALNAAPALVYAGVATVGCFAVAWIQTRVARRIDSPLLAVDVQNWTLDGFVNLGVAAAFLIAAALAGTQWDWAVPFVDPVLLAGLVLLLVWVPIRTVLDNVAELLQVAPALAVQADVVARVEASVSGLALKGTSVRMVKIGRYFYVLTHLITAEDFGARTVRQLDTVRNSVAVALDGVHPNLVLETVFTEDESVAIIE